ncbi:Peptidase C19, ubiquitin carboxyl-terminal hydrolase 2 [Ascosphaera apis ARSEF 7405]|uniref:ubiquitinyl hydrolase 1 n=1 Tax=Ascosphaera apis ARSEF 7405 TaxID=392613 RepID=A0A167ZU56_9EURO|nr:Peptidase C19, ubiquitin carboxyl-terminal hydrolase 2 [Ascosphaera apis ARSEF 7405]
MSSSIYNSRSSLYRDQYRVYHDHSASRRLVDSNAVVFVCLSAALVYHILRHFKILSVSFSEVAWHAFICLLPRRIIRRLNGYRPGQEALLEGLQSPSFTERHLAKSAIMLRYLGISTSSFPGAAELSTLHTRFVSTRSSDPPGLGNWDNSCYQNSIIHGLAALPALSEYLSQNLKHLAGRNAFRTHLALKDIIDLLNDSRNAGSVLWIPTELKSMSSWQQQDAQEYFSKIIEEVDRESRQALVGFTKNPGLTLDDSFKIKGDVTAEELPCSLRNPLEGLIAQRVGCTQCGWCEEISLIPFNCLTVSLGRRSDNDLQQCLDDYTDLERIEGVECAKCTLLKRKEQLQSFMERFDKLKTPPEDSEKEASLRGAVEEKLQIINEVLENEDFSDSTLTKKCAIARPARVQSTKTRQAVIARPPKSLVIHINRSVFDESTGMLVKNSAPLRFPKTMDITEWCLGAQAIDEGHKDEIWAMDPATSLLPVETLKNTAFGQYELKAVICHFGRHDTGHYVCYRKFSAEQFPYKKSEEEEDYDILDDEEEEKLKNRWFRLSDEKVSAVSEGCVLAQTGAFMLFYEAVLDDSSEDMNGQSSAGLNEKAPKSNGHVDAPTSPLSSSSSWSSDA